MITIQNHSDNDLKTFTIALSASPPSTYSGLLKLSNDLSDRFILLMDKPNYVEPYSENVTDLVLIGDESYLSLKKVSVTDDRFYKANGNGTVFGHEVDYSIINNLNASAQITLTFLRIKDDCETDACNI